MNDICKRTLSSRLSEKAANFQRSKKKVRKKINLKTISEVDNTTVDPTTCSKNNSTVSSKVITRFGRPFFNQPCISLAKSLLGKLLVRKVDSGEVIKGKIVETECYLGCMDKASHSYQGKRTERNEAMFLPPGTAYVYSVYGMYYCFNISSLEEGSAVLIRAVEPLENTSVMLKLRTMKRKGTSVLKDRDLCNGPSKICQAFQIEKKTINKLDLCSSTVFWIEDGIDIPDCDIVACKRIGIESVGEEWANKPLRFYIRGNMWISVRNKVAENLCGSDRIFYLFEK